VGIQRGRPDSRPEEVPGFHEERRSWRSGFVGTGSLACPRCDAPAPLLSEPAGPTSLLGCPYCEHTGAVRDFLTFGEPLRAPRVNVFVRM
jgi:hypothetical protein